MHRLCFGHAQAKPLLDVMLIVRVVCDKPAKYALPAGPAPCHLIRALCDSIAAGATRVGSTGHLGSAEATVWPHRLLTVARRSPPLPQQSGIVPQPRVLPTSIDCPLRLPTAVGPP